MNFESMQSFFERHYDDIQPDGSMFIRKGLVDRVEQYKIVINAGDHEPPHIHISLNNQQVGSYLISSGEPLRVFHRNSKIDSLVKFWFNNESNRAHAVNEWKRLSGV